MNSKDEYGVYVVDIEPPDCDGGFADVECLGQATKEISVELAPLGMAAHVGFFCGPCADRASARLLAKETE